MPTCRAIVGQAMRALQALAPGDEASADELTVGLEAIADLMLELHEARGPLLDIDAASDVTPGENQRVRIEAGDTVSVTLPNSVPVLFGYDPYDYGFNAGVVTPAIGGTGVADGITWRAPRDGARIEIVGVTQALYFYRSDINEWLAATGLTLDGETPLNARYGAPLAALVAERMSEQGTWTPTPALARRVARARAQLFIRPGVTRDAVTASYL